MMYNVHKEKVEFVLKMVWCDFYPWLLIMKMVLRKNSEILIYTKLVKLFKLIVTCRMTLLRIINKFNLLNISSICWFLINNYMNPNFFSVISNFSKVFWVFEHFVRLLEQNLTMFEISLTSIYFRIKCSKFQKVEFEH